MDAISSLTKLWKTLGINGQVVNYSSKPLWVLKSDKNSPTLAMKLLPGFKSPAEIDIDAFKRVDGGVIEGHRSWWKFWDVSKAEVFDKGRTVKVSVIRKTAVKENHFGKPLYQKEKWGSPIKLIIDAKRDEKKRINLYHVTGEGWIDYDAVLKMTCRHEIANARPVFPKNGRPYIRTKRDSFILNNLNIKGRA